MTRQEEFQKRLVELVKEYDVEIQLEDFGTGYSTNYKIMFYGYATDAIIDFGCTYIDKDRII